MTNLPRATLVVALFAGTCGMAHAQMAKAVQPAPQVTDWGGGYLRGPDSASVTVATSGAGKPPVAAAPAPTPAPTPVPMTDWGGGYLRGPDSASTTVATSGAGPAKPN